VLIVTSVCFTYLLIKILYATMRMMVAKHLSITQFERSSNSSRLYKILGHSPVSKLALLQLPNFFRWNLCSSIGSPFPWLHTY